MDFELSQDQRLLARTAHELIAKKSPVSRARRLREDTLGFEPALWRTLSELGWLGLPFAESVGGYGSGFIELALVLEQFGRELVSEPFIASVVLAGTTLAHGGTAAQQQRFLAPMIAGEQTLALAYAERDSRFDLHRPHVSALHQGSGYLLHGEKVWVENGHAADHIVVSARLDGETALFVIDRGQKGLHITPLDTFDGRKAAHLQLDGVYAEPDRRLAARPALDVLELALDRAAAAAVAEGLGITQRVLDMTVDYLKTREQFDVKIGTFQALQHRAVDMFTETQLLRSIALKVMVEVDHGDPAVRRRAVSAGKVQLSVAGKLVTRQAIQLHGGIGCTDEHDVGLYFKRMQVLNTLYGDEAYHVARSPANQASTPADAPHVRVTRARPLATDALVRFPDFPDVLSSQRAQSSVYMRYEDVAQDGSLKVGGMPHAIGLVCLGKLWFKTQLSNQTRPHGIVPIMTRLAMTSLNHPISVRNPVEADGSYQLAHTKETQRGVDRILLNAHVELFAPIGKTHPPQPHNAGEVVLVGRAFAEHVFTRPQNPVGERKVVALPTADGPLVPGPTLPFREALATLSLPDSTNWLEPQLLLDSTPLTFGLTHTDANHHVNTLVYPQLFEDAALRRLMDLGYDTRTLLVDYIDIAFRKPCFAGQRMFVWVRAFERAGKLGVVAYLGPTDCEPARAHCMCALTFRNGELG